MRLHFSILSLFFCTSLLGQDINSSYAIPFEKNCTYGLVQTNGKVIVSPKFKKIQELYPGIPLFVVTSVTNKQSVINSKGELVIPIPFDSIYGQIVQLSYNLEKNFAITVKHNAKKTYYNIRGNRLKTKEELAPFNGFCGNTDYEPLSDNIFFSNGKYGLIHKEEVQVKAIYDTIISWGDYFIAKENDQAGVLTMYGDTAYNFGNYDFRYDIQLSGLVITDKRTNLKGFYAKSYKGICNLPCIYEDITAVIYDRYFLVKEPDRCEYYFDFITGKKFKE